MTGDALIFKGHGFYDFFIRLFTRSDFTHIALDLGDNMLIESYPGVGVRIRRYSDHEMGLCRFRYTDQATLQRVFPNIRKWVMSQVGKKYDYWGIIGFAFNDPKLHDLYRWFCSTFFDVAYEIGGIILFHKKETLIDPGDIAANPLFDEIK